MRREELYTIGEVAALLGVSTHTIRAWERRHGIVRPTRTRTHQRRYRSEDIELLRDVKRAIDLHGYSLRLAYETVSGAVEPNRGPRQPARRQGAENSLTGDTDLWRTVVDFLPYLVLVLDRDGTIVESNVSVARALNTMRQRLRGRKFIELVDPFDRQKAALLYRPHPRTTSGWELNISTARGTRLYSFQTWTVHQGDRVLLAMVGTEMFTENRRVAESSQVTTQLSGEPQEIGAGRATVVRTLQSLLDQLPYGVGVATIGSDPRVLYANAQMLDTLHLRSRGLTGRRLSEVMPDPKVVRALHDVARSRRPRTLADVRLPSGRRSVNDGRSFNVSLRPVTSTNRIVTGVLLVLDDQTYEVAQRARLARLVVDDKLRAAQSMDELATLGVRHLVTMLPGVDFIVRLEEPWHPASKHKPAPHSSARLTGMTHERSRAAVIGLLERVELSRQHAELLLDEAGAAYHVHAVPIMADDHDAARPALGVAAWRTPAGRPLAPHERAAIDSFLVQIATAAQLLRLRMESSGRLQLRGLAVERSAHGPSGQAG